MCGIFNRRIGNYICQLFGFDWPTSTKLLRSKKQLLHTSYTDVNQFSSSAAQKWRKANKHWVLYFDCWWKTYAFNSCSLQEVDTWLPVLLLYWDLSDTSSAHCRENLLVLFMIYFSNLVIQWLKYLKLISAELSCSLLFVCLCSFLLILPKNDLCIKLCKCHNKIFIKLSCRIQHNQSAASQIFCTKSRNFSKWPSSKSRWLLLVFQYLDARTWLTKKKTKIIL